MSFILITYFDENGPSYRFISKDQLNFIDCYDEGTIIHISFKGGDNSFNKIFGYCDSYNGFVNEIADFIWGDRKNLKLTVYSSTKLLPESISE